MAQNITNDSDNKKNLEATISQIILQNEIVYFIKFAAYIFMAVTLLVGFKKLDVTDAKDFAGIFIFVLTTAIDAVVLGGSVKIKGKINRVLIGFIVVLVASLFIVFSIFAGLLEISQFWISICELIGFLCCLSPILEMIYDIISRLQNEKQRNY